MNLKSLKYYSPVLLLIILFTSCEENVNTVKLPEFKQMLAIASFISPSDSVSYVFVTSNKRLYGELNRDEKPGNLTATVSDGTIEISLDTVSNGLVFNNEKMQIQHGKTYTLKITSDKGLSAEASCTVPEKRDFDLNVDTFYIEEHLFPIDDTLYRVVFSREIAISFSDYPGEENYYRINPVLSNFYTDHTTGEVYSYKSEIRLDKEYYSDHGIDGKKIVLRFSSGSYSPYYKGASSDSSLLTVHLYNTEKSYYLYHKSLENYNSGENPFSEATPVYSNIKGGLGIFTSYTVDSIVYVIK